MSDKCNELSESGKSWEKFEMESFEPPFSPSKKNDSEFVSIDVDGGETEGFAPFEKCAEEAQRKKEAEDIELPFIDSKKVCNKCGESIYLTNKYCGSCGSQVIYTDNVGIYTSKCTKCNGYIYDKAEFCPTCGNEVTKQE